MLGFMKLIGHVVHLHVFVMGKKDFEGPLSCDISHCCFAVTLYLLSSSFWFFNLILFLFYFSFFFYFLCSSKTIAYIIDEGGPL